MSLIAVEPKDGAKVLRMVRGVTNAIDLDLVLALGKELEAIEEEGSSDGIVLTGNDKFFSIGFDLPALVELDRKDMATFYKAINRVSIGLYLFPRPTVAAIAGHATAGGCILALCCDHRFIAEGHKLMGLNEIKLGLPVPYPADRILTQMVGERHARDIMGSGDFYKPEASLAMGMVDKVLPIDQVLEACLEKARTLGQMPVQAFRKIKANRVEPVKGQVLARLESREEAFLDMWFSEDTQKLLQEALKNF